MSMPALFKGRLSIPVIGSPLFIISVPDLVIAQCKAGVVGAFPALNARPPELLDEWLARIPENLPTSDPSKMNFGTDASGERAKPKAWKEIWGSGQGVGSIGAILPAAEL